MRTNALPLEAWEHALIAAKDQVMGNLDGFVHHCDRGSQYVSILCTDHLTQADVTASVGRAGDAYDNAIAETVNGLCKTELIYARSISPSKTEQAFETMHWAHWWNTCRIHAVLGENTSEEVETAHYETRAVAIASAR